MSSSCLSDRTLSSSSPWTHGVNKAETKWQFCFPYSFALVVQMVEVRGNGDIFVSMGLSKLEKQNHISRKTFSCPPSNPSIRVYLALTAFNCASGSQLPGSIITLEVSTDSLHWQVGGEVCAQRDVLPS